MGFRGADQIGGTMKIRAWHIGEYGEIYAAQSEEEVRNFLIGLIGETESKESIEDCFEELTPQELNQEVEFEGCKTTLRKVAEDCELPTQISTCYC
jgi:hypothetical protein